MLKVISKYGSIANVFEMINTAMTVSSLENYRQIAIDSGFKRLFDGRMEFLRIQSAIEELSK